MPASIITLVNGTPALVDWRIVSSYRIAPEMCSASFGVGQQHLAIGTAILFGVLDADGVETLLDRVVGLVDRDDALAGRDHRLGDAFELFDAHDELRKFAVAADAHGRLARARIIGQVAARDAGCELESSGPERPCPCCRADPGCRRPACASQPMAAAFVRSRTGRLNGITTYVDTGVLPRFCCAAPRIAVADHAERDLAEVAVGHQSVSTFDMARAAVLLDDIGRPRRNSARSGCARSSARLPLRAAGQQQPIVRQPFGRISPGVFRRRCAAHVQVAASIALIRSDALSITASLTESPSPSATPPGPTRSSLSVLVPPCWPVWSPCVRITRSPSARRCILYRCWIAALAACAGSTPCGSKSTGVTSRYSIMRRRADCAPRQRVDRHAGTVARQPLRGAAGFGQRDDRAHADAARRRTSPRARSPDRYGRACAHAGAQVFARLELALGAQAHAAHRGDGLVRMLAGRGFLRQHHRVGAVEHGVGDVEHFGARRDRRLDHRLHHLRRGDHRPCCAPAFRG